MRSRITCCCMTETVVSECRRMLCSSDMMVWWIRSVQLVRHYIVGVTSHYVFLYSNMSSYCDKRVTEQRTNQNLHLIHRGYIQTSSLRLASVLRVVAYYSVKPTNLASYLHCKLCCRHAEHAFSRHYDHINIRSLYAYVFVLWRRRHNIVCFGMLTCGACGVCVCALLLKCTNIVPKHDRLRQPCTNTYTQTQNTSYVVLHAHTCRYAPL